MQAAIRRLQQRGARSVVLDLRGNPGGLVEESQLVSSLFLKGGSVVTMKGRSVRSRTLKAGNKPRFPKLPLVVLVDGNSASASEIVTGALQDRNRATIVGTRTFGKGVFQEVLELGSGGALDITVGQFFTPKGRNFGGAGVVGGENVSRGKGLSPMCARSTIPRRPAPTRRWIARSRSPRASSADDPYGGGQRGGRGGGRPQGRGGPKRRAVRAGASVSSGAATDARRAPAAWLHAGAARAGGARP